MAEGEELQRAVCHLSLDVLDAGGSCVFSRFGVIIKEVWGTTEVSVRILKGGVVIEVRTEYLQGATL